jgi:glucose uptake protein GlcU
MLNRLPSARITRNVLIPGWIAAFGCVFLVAPAQGVGLSTALFLAGVLVVPAIGFIPRAGDVYAPRGRRVRF